MTKEGSQHHRGGKEKGASVCVVGEVGRALVAPLGNKSEKVACRE